MQTSVKLENMEKHFDDLLALIDKDQNIKRYLTYLSDNPLKTSSAQPNITKSLINDNIQLSFFNEKIVSGNKCFLFFNLLDSDLERNPIGEERYLFDIIIPNEYWRLKGLKQFRATRIGIAICQLLDQQNITGVGEVKVGKFRCYKLNNTHQGATLSVTVGTSNMKK